MNDQRLSDSRSKTASLLIADDDNLILATLSLGLKEVGYTVYEAHNGEEALYICSQYVPDLAILDIRLPGISGIELAKTLYETINIPFLFLSAFNDPGIVNDAVNQGALGYLVKPIDFKQLLPAIETALKRAADIKQLTNQHDNLNNALSQSREISIAIGIFMAHTSYTKQQAETVLRSYARKTRQKMSVVARSIIDASEELNTLINKIQKETAHNTGNSS